MNQREEGRDKDKERGIEGISERQDRERETEDRNERHTHITKTDEQ